MEKNELTDFDAWYASLPNDENPFAPSYDSNDDDDIRPIAVLSGSIYITNGQ